MMVLLISLIDRAMPSAGDATAAADSDCYLRSARDGENLRFVQRLDGGCGVGRRGERELPRIAASSVFSISLIERVPPPGNTPELSSDAFADTPPATDSVNIFESPWAWTVTVPEAVISDLAMYALVVPSISLMATLAPNEIAALPPLKSSRRRRSRRRSFTFRLIRGFDGNRIAASGSGDFAALDEGAGVLRDIGQGDGAGATQGQFSGIGFRIWVRLQRERGTDDDLKNARPGEGFDGHGLCCKILPVNISPDVTVDGIDCDGDGQCDRPEFFGLLGGGFTGVRGSRFFGFSWGCFPEGCLP